MDQQYKPQELEARVQQFWAEGGSFEVSEDPDKNRCKTPRTQKPETGSTLVVPV